ncbi:uncharacterized protein [Primulina eburnea]|uniref:uncharacterized protein n=1 Tax=Primulina eburnea TaxID=1245227 RepID=UPI003C6BDB3D
MAGRPPRNNRNARDANQNDNPPPPPPPRVNLSQEDMMAIATIVAATLQGFVNPLANAIQPPQEPQPRGIKYHYESLRRNRVPTFDGNPDPEVSHNWLKNVETQLHLLEIPEELKVEVVTPFLEDRARKWWETVSLPLAEVEDITWPIFKREFLKQYYPAEFRLQKLNEFENFRQSPDMMVMEYTSKFNDLGTYVPTIMSDETLKMHRFKKGLNSRIQSALAVYKPSSFADLMGAAMSAETDIKRREEENKNKRPMNNQSTQNNLKFKKPNYSGGSFKGSSDRTGNTEGKWCDTCRQKHIGECYRKTGACFKCGKVGHRIKDCPDNKVKGSGPNKQHENKTNARVYAITQEEADNSNEVVAELIQLNMVEFDIILGMDWLAKNHAIVDCQKKEIRLQTPAKREVVYQGKSKERKSLLSASQAWKAIKGGEEIYLAVINEVKEEEVPKLEDIPIVQEFPDVFPEELPGEIPDREVEFEINLAPDAVPISKAPYRMAPAELKDLKEQLQELLDKKQIRPSASPWGAPVLFLSSGKANKVADALSRRNPGKVSLSSLSVQPSLQETIKLKQSQDTNIFKIKEQIQEGKIPEFQIDKDGILWMKGRLYVPNINGIREEKDVAVFVAKCLVCQQVKAEHQRPGGLLQPLEIPEWKWDNISMDFVVGLPKSRQGHDGIWVIIDRLTKSAHFLPVRMNYNLDKLATLYMDNIVKLHGVPVMMLKGREFGGKSKSSGVVENRGVCLVWLHRERLDRVCEGFSCARVNPSLGPDPNADDPWLSVARTLRELREKWIVVARVGYDVVGILFGHFAAREGLV